MRQETLQLKIAIVQERFGTGGRERVVATMLEVLNSMGIVPDVFSLEHRASLQDLKLLYGLDVRCNFRRIPDLLPPGLHGAEAAYTNVWIRCLRHLGSSYRALINMNGSMAFCSPRVPSCFYISVPESYVVLSQRVAAEAGLVRRWRNRIHKALVRKFDVPRKKFIIVCNCIHTRELFHSVWPQAEPRVLYPPLDVKAFRPDPEKKKQIVNVGRFSSQKRQIEFIGLAKDLRDYCLVCVGPQDNKPYVERCTRYVAEERLENVRLLPPLPLAELKSLLEQSMFYVHMFRHEPFGIATAEAIAAGCIPVVPDSWGNREIVSIAQLRYRRDEDIVGIIRTLEVDPKVSAHYRDKLQRDIKAFDKTIFVSQFKSILKELATG